MTRFNVAFLICGFLACGFSGAAVANAASCTLALSEGQKTQIEFCETHPGCRLVTSLIGSCDTLGRFLAGIGSGKPDTLIVARALSGIGVSSDGAEVCAAGIDATGCRTGIDKVALAQVQAADTSKEGRLNALYRRQKLLLDALWAAKGKDTNGHLEYRRAHTQLELCAQGKADTRREQMCLDAQKAVDQCNRVREQWGVEKEAVFRELEALGEPRPEYGMIREDMPPCPYTLPNTSLTPDEALKQWQQEESGTQNRFPTRNVPEDIQSVLEEEVGKAETERKALVEKARLEAEAKALAAEEARKAEEARLVAEAAAKAEAERVEREKQAAYAAAAETQTEQGGSDSFSSDGVSICQRNLDKMNEYFSANNLDQVAGWSAHYELEINQMLMKLMAPCADFDSNARDWVDMLPEWDRKTVAYCQSNTCTFFGENLYGAERADKNRRYYEAFMRMGNEALADPNWSAAGQTPGGTGRAGSGACAAGLQRIEREVSAIERRKPSNAELIPTLQSTMYAMQLIIDHLQNQCAGQPEAGQLAQYQQIFTQTQQTCRQMSSSPQVCAPKLNW